MKKRKSKKLEDKKKDEDSISEITDLDKEEILTNYYSKKLSSIQKRKLERGKLIQRLRGETYEMKHICCTQHKYRIIPRETVEVELR